MTELLPYQLLPAAWIVGWTLVHFLWQATLVAAVASFALACIQNRGSSARYLVCAVSLATMAAAPLLTAWWLATTPTVDVPSLALTTLVIAPDLRQRIELLVPGLTLLWVAGVWVMQLRIAAQLIGARGLVRTGTAPLPEPQAGMVRSLCTHLGLPRAVEAYRSTRAAVPMVVGWLRPVVLVPTAALAGLSTAQLRAVLAHELAHVKRHDALVNLAQSVFESLFFFHPAVWWLSSRLREEREFCCDDIAVATCGDPLTYAKALAALDDARSATPAAALAANGGSLVQRITRLLDSGVPARRARGWIAPMVMTLSLTAVVSAMSLSVDEEPAPSVALKGVDLVDVVAPVDGELAEILSILRSGGMDDATLLEFVSRLGTSPEVVDAIQGATERAALEAEHLALKERMAEAQGVIEQDAADGLITKEEARLRVEELHREAEQHLKELGPPPGDTFLLRKSGPNVLHRGKNVKIRVSDDRMQAEVAHLKHKLHALHEAVAAGQQTAEEAGPAMEKVQKHLHELLLREAEHAAKARVMVELAPEVGDLHLSVQPRLEVHPEHDLHFGPEGNVWVNEPALIGEVELQPLENVQLVQTRWSTGEPHEHSHEHAHSAAIDLWTPALDDSAVEALHEHLQSAVPAEEVHGHLRKIYTVLREMHADEVHVPHQTTIEPVHTNVLLDVSLQPLVEVPVHLSVEPSVESSVEWVEEVSEQPAELIEEVEASDET